MARYKILTYGNSWKKYKQRNFYTLSKGGETVLCSYNTVVGLVVDNTAFLTNTKYSQTTSKQMTQYCREQNLGSVRLENCFLEDLLTKYGFVA